MEILLSIIIYFWFIPLVFPIFQPQPAEIFSSPSASLPMIFSSPSTESSPLIFPSLSPLIPTTIPTSSNVPSIKPQVCSDAFPPSVQSTLREYADKKGLSIGSTLLSKWFMPTSETQLAELLAKEFRTATVWLSMEYTQTSQGTFNFTWLDKAIEFAKQNDLYLIGLPLVYRNNTSPSWLGFANGNCGGWSKPELEAILKTHIQTLVNHAKNQSGGRVFAWEVVNEPLSQIGTTCWSKILASNEPLGYESYIAKSFQWAHEADPNALLLLNDTFSRGSNVFPDRIGRINQFFDLVKRLKQNGTPIHVVGTETHIRVNELDFDYVAEFRYFLEKAKETNVQVWVTEMDVYQGKEGAENWVLQTMVFKDIMKTCLEYTHCTNVTYWGLGDSDSWLRGSSVNLPKAQPLLFDDIYQRKPVYYSVMETISQNATRTCLTPSPSIIPFTN